VVVVSKWDFDFCLNHTGASLTTPGAARSIDCPRCGGGSIDVCDRWSSTASTAAMDWEQVCSIKSSWNGHFLRMRLPFPPPWFRWDAGKLTPPG